jgi:hypothetical protein
MNGCLFLEKKKSLNIKKIISLSWLKYEYDMNFILMGNKDNKEVKHKKNIANN